MDEIAKTREIAQVAYETYAAFLEWFGDTGEPLPSWPEIHPDKQKAWRRVAQAVLTTAGLLGMTQESPSTTTAGPLQGGIVLESDIVLYRA